MRRFNEENNEEAGEHWTPRDAVRLMAKLVFLPIASQITSGTYLVYDGACGTGGMLTVAEETLAQLAAEQGKQVSIHLLRAGDKPETYAICKADLMLKGEGEAADNIVGGSEYSTLSNDAFPNPVVRFHALQSSLWQELEDRSATHGRKEGNAGPAFVGGARWGLPSSRWSLGPVTARCCSWPTWSRR